ncbi:unnamed protein product [Sphagnum troendelagicum]|uniref:K Homology domain-containing protein n=1 Tax=Sphagnum troendelagicum TaxID=128251 RepID=A0ABP0TAY8_9BRYO
MADGGGFTAVEESNAPRVENKRKFDDATGVVVADESGLRYSYSNNNAKAGDDDSGLPAATPAPVSYNSVAPPMSEFELAKQRAELIAARLVTGAELKRPRTEENNSDEQQQQQQNGVDRSNGSDFDQGYPDHNQEGDRPPEDDRTEQLHHHHQQQQQQQQHQQQFQHPPLQDYQQPQYYNQQGDGSTQSKNIDVPNSKVGLIIGKGGETIKYLQQQSGARIQVARDADSDPRLSTRQVEIMGSAEQISHAEQLVRDVIAEASSGGPGGHGGRGYGPSSGEQIQVKVPNNKVGLIIGRGGETIKSLQSRSGVRIQVQNDSETEPGATERIVTLIGNKKATDIAYDMIKEVIDENRVPRGPPGGYHNQHGGYRPSGPPQQWGPPSAPPPSYGGYSQATQYPGPQQYQGPPQAYGAYPQQPSSGYTSSGWDQRSPATAAQPLQQGSYDYYAQQGQQPPQTAPVGGTTTDTTAYGYGQQGYYGGYQQQQQPPQAAGYADQTGAYGQQQGYTQQGYSQQGYNGYGYAQPSQQQGDQQGYSQQGFSYGQPQAGYATTQPTEGSTPAAPSGYDYTATATPAPSSATAPVAAPTAQS